MTITNLALIGPRGAGKSKISRKLSRKVSRVMLSIDNLICYEMGGRTIQTLVDEIGWQGFRDLEYGILARVCQMSAVILDCGGGILVEAPATLADPESFSRRKASLLKKNARVVYIKRSWDWLISKSGLDPSRPALGNDYLSILEQRLPWYEETADYVLDMTRNQPIADGVDELARVFFSTTKENR